MRRSRLLARESSGRSSATAILAVLLSSLNVACATRSASTHPSFAGIWQAANAIGAVVATDGSQPPLLPAARLVFESNRAAIRADDRSIDGTNRCLPAGLPRILFENTPFEILQRSDRIVFLFEYQRLIRQIYIDGTHPDGFALVPFMGHSVARWDGDALVVDTIGLNGQTLLDAGGLPHSDDLHLIERIRLIHGNRQLEFRITLDDPQTFSSEWETVRVFERRPGTKLKEDVCLDREGLRTSLD